MIELFTTLFATVFGLLQVYLVNLLSSFFGTGQ